MVLPLEEALDPALALLGDVHAGAVVELDRHRGRVLVAEADGEPADSVRRLDQEAGDGGRGDLQVEHVDPGGVESGHERRFSIRAERLESREVTTVSPLRRLVP